MSKAAFEAHTSSVKRTGEAMRIVYEWDQDCGAYRYNHRDVAIGTKAEIDAQIASRAGNAEVRIVGLNNTRADFEAYCGPVAGDYPYGFIDSLKPQKSESS